MSVKKVFVDTLKFATDMELKNSLSTILMLQDFFDLFFFAKYYGLIYSKYVIINITYIYNGKTILRKTEKNN